MVLFLARALALFALGEFLLLRFLLRLGPILPEGRAMTQALEWLWRLGVLVMNVATVAGLALLAALAFTLVRDRGERVPLFLKLGVALTLAVVLAGLVGPLVLRSSLNPYFLLVTSAASLLIPILAGIGLASCKPARLPLAVMGAAYAAGFYHYATRASSAVGMPVPGGGIALGGAEGLLLFLAPALCLVFRPRWHLRAGLAASLLAGAYLALLIARPPVTSALLMWDFGFTGWLTPYTYVFALGVLAYAIGALWQERRHGAALGLALLALGGLRLEYAYFSLLAMTGFWLVTRALWQHHAPQSQGAEKRAERTERMASTAMNPRPMR